MAPGLKGKIQLLNFWKDYGHGYEEASYLLQDGVCYLQGLITRDPFQLHSTIGMLPEGCRPRGTILLTVSNHNNGAGGGSLRVDILASGELQLVGGNVQANYISLSGLSFFVA